MPNPSKWIVDTDWLAARLGSPDLIILDGSMHLPTSGRNARAEFVHRLEIGKIDPHGRTMVAVVPSPGRETMSRLPP